MNRFTRVILCATLLTLAVVGVSRVAGLGFSGAFSSLLDLEKVRERMARIREQSRILELTMERSRQRLREMEKIGRDLIDGRLSLLEAAALARDVKDRPTYFLTIFRRYEFGATDDERWCSYVIGWVDSYLSDEPARRAEVTARLSREYREEVERSGGICLPQ